MQVGGCSASARDSRGRDDGRVQIDGGGIRRRWAIDRGCRCDDEWTSWILAGAKATLMSEGHAAE
jgi:hypothetical protein